MSDQELRTVALFMNEDEDIAKEFGEAIEWHWNGPSFGEVVNSVVKGLTTGAVTGWAVGDPGVAATFGAIASPAKLKVEHQVDKRLEKDYSEYEGFSGKKELVKDTYQTAVTESKEQAQAAGVEKEQYATEEMLTEEEIKKRWQNDTRESDTENSPDDNSMDAEQVENNMIELSQIEKGDWVDLSQNQREKYIKTLQERDLMSKILVGTMAKIEIDDSDHQEIELDQRVKKGASEVAELTPEKVGVKSGNQAFEGDFDITVTDAIDWSEISVEDSDIVIGEEAVDLAECRR